ncbi:MAG: cation-translocating P-type ATPase [Planctomycetales bacterium]|nr:cation-translocating P-type ATPase [Planctomycetales bacterium]
MAETSALAAGQSAAAEYSQHEPEYCCFGCRFAADVTAEGGETGETRWTLTRLGIAIFFTMNVMVFTLALWSRDVYADQPSVGTATAQSLYELLRYACLMFATPVVLLLGGPLLEQAIDSARRRELTTDWLLAAGVLAALLYSIISVLSGGTHVYFEVPCMVLVFVTLGRWLEATGKLKTTAAIRSLQKLLPETVQVVDETGSRTLPLNEIEPGEIVRVLPGQRIPLDGIICRNRANIDEQLVTGESEPVPREVGDRVYAGSLNLDGDLSVKVTEAASTGTIQRLVDLVVAAVSERGREQRLADRLTSAFVPLVTLISISTFAYYASTRGFHSALMSSLAVVLIACPCALGIATPMAIWAALGTACREHVLFRHGDALSRLARVKTICFDKTGTLTRGEAAVEALHIAEDESRDEVLRRACVLAAASQHVLGRSILRYAKPAHTPCPLHVEHVAGRGVSTRLDDTDVAAYMGNLAYMNQVSQQVSPQLAEVLADCQTRAMSLTCVAWEGKVRGLFVFREELRERAQEAIEQLRQLGLHVVLLTGDHQQRADLLAEQLNIDVRAELLPEDKLAAIQSLRAEHGEIAMVGDGINDAPALAAADVGIAMGCGADVSRDAADVCLLGSDLDKIPWSVEWARGARRVIWQNLFWAFAYNSVGVTLAAFEKLNPIVAAVAMVGSSLFVISNSMRLATTTVAEPPSSETTPTPTPAPEVMHA